MHSGTSNGKENNTYGNTDIIAYGNKGSGTNKRRRVAAAFLTLAIGLCMAAPTVRAEELSSQGNLNFRDKEKSAQIYAADFLLLKNRLDTIPDTVFDPDCYTHTHRWEYHSVNEKTHTRHCESCGDTFDLVAPHKAERTENCTLTYDGAEYPGIRYTCICGYQWEHEKTHTLFFEAAGETGHRSRCRLDGTKFCPGYEPVLEEHYAYYYTPCEDGCHHERICMDCGYRDVEQCCFNLPETPDSGEGSGDAGTGEDKGGMRYCWCGNAEKPDASAENENAETVTDEETTETETENISGEPVEGKPNVGAEGENAAAETEETEETACQQESNTLQ